MRKIKSSILLAFILLFNLPFTQAKDALELWYNQPAGVWEEALPLGNGMTGAMIFGGVQSEHYALNDHTLWSGEPLAGNRVNGPEVLGKVRAAIFEESYEKAGTLWRGMHGPYSARYLTLGDLFLNFNLNENSIGQYCRKLDLRTAVSEVSFQKDGVTYKRESFISFPDKALVIRLTASKKNKITFDAVLDSKLNHDVQVLSPNNLVLKGKAPSHVAQRESEPQQIIYEPNGKGMTFEIHLEMRVKGGQTVNKKNAIGVKDAEEVLLIMSEATSFNGFDKSPSLEGKDPSKLANDILNKVRKKNYSTLLQRHLTDYTNLFGRVEIDLGKQQMELPTDTRLLKYNAGNVDNGLIALYFQYGRYLMIASSRPGTPPSNLQGIWSPHVQPPWGSNYTININTEMNYWPAENTNLSECHQPLFDFMEGLAVNGAVTAKVNYDIKNGWLAHHNSDIWAKTSPAGGEDWDPKGSPRWSCWPMGGAWFCQHLWEHYLYTGDKKFLAEKAWPLMRGAAEFMLGWLVEDKNGNLVTNPSSSPENVFNYNGKKLDISMASTMDMSIIRELFSNCMHASAELNVSDDFTSKIKQAIPRLYPFKIGQYGQLQEWYKDWDDPKDSHRHLSHLFSLFPGNQITPEKTPELAKAAKQALINRGDVSTGWSMAWKINWWARLKDGNHALKILNDGLTYIGKKSEVMGGGGTYANLFCAHPPFQIDGNFGGTAGIAEMLMQSHEGFIYLLPALPNQWPSGKISGLVARGGFTLDMQWENGKMKKLTIVSKLGGVCRIKFVGAAKCSEAQLVTAVGTNPNRLQFKPDDVRFENDSKTSLTDLAIPKADIYDLNTEAGKTYHLDWSN
ncbi:MAG TPA: glycoside hydrolase family 95 protein [Bacteroidales bacterium]|nr:glycoside hydrolase family 95 protein [Bacteroidales bacterium]